MLYFCQKNAVSTREAIIEQADHLIRDKGYNAFSYYDLSKSIGIKNASIHYHFPSKSDLGVAVVQKHLRGLAELRQETKTQSPLQQLEAFFSIYDQAQRKQKICLVGALATDFHTIDEQVQAQLKILAEQVLAWVTEILIQGQNEGFFQFKVEARTKAMLIISNMLASVQLIRLTHADDFERIKAAILFELNPQSI